MSNLVSTQRIPTPFITGALVAPRRLLFETLEIKTFDFKFIILIIIN